jgi:hypothetical protein
MRILKAALKALTLTLARRDYSELPQFANYDVRFLLDVREEDDSVVFTVEAANTYDHSRAGWSKILIVFPKVKLTRWLRKEMQPLVDEDGSVYYGEIDSFIVNRDLSRVTGDWGEVEIVSEPIEVIEIEHCD